MADSGLPDLRPKLTISKPEPKSEQLPKTYSIELKLIFSRTNLEVDDPDPTPEELDHFFTTAYKNRPSSLDSEEDYPKFLSYINSLYIYGNYGEYPDDVKYHGNGLVSCFLTEVLPNPDNQYTKDGIFKSTEEIINDLKEASDSLCDGMWEGCPGSEGVYPQLSSWNPETSEFEMELGVIDIDIESIKINIV
jgi:hypothetical protein